MNIDPLDPETLRGIVERCGWPPVSVFGRTLEGPDAWRHVIDRAAPVERRVLLGRLHRHLLSSSTEGRERLRTYLDEQRSTPSPIETRAQRTARIAKAVRYFGDAEAFPV